MARIRSIKPEFWTAEQVMELSRDARLLFIGLWNFSDDAGIHPARVRTLKAEVFPSDDLSASDVRRMVDELIAARLVVEIEINGDPFWKANGRYIGSCTSRLPASQWKPIRMAVFERDGFTCRYCAAYGVQLECDHIVPISKGGTNDMDNLATACVTCNRDKRDKTLDEWERSRNG